MTLTKSITDILNGTIESVKAVLPFEIKIDKPSLFTQPFTQHSIGVLIGMTGDVRGRVIIDGEEEIFGKIGEGMFGMFLEGEMLESFAGELGNMIAGNLSTTISQRGFEMDITPPTVFVGQTKIYGFNRAFRLPVHIANVGIMEIVLAVELD
ncbi:chemotaxis protein CheX [Robertmurraya andreesenii]|uniref:Chemotaxis protein CheX n=1 Tax=Anoxybacillus andreesenii TaxID=1325932 RepID=A0ABT9V2H4_9BACL|nr:chemotaxis protein CheX [Robertmurraya andreesenii]MDQ0155154.1 chemotaxis protein CheX [Robertmurraya andreesenii]